MQQSTAETPKDRLQEVLYHWMPRMQAVGLSFDDVRRLIDEAGEWRRWCQTWSAEAARHHQEGDEARDKGRLLTAGEAYTRAALFYHFGQFMFFDDLSQKDTASQKKVAVYHKAAPYLSPPATPVKIPYAEGYLSGFQRDSADKNDPLVIIAPGSDSTKEEEGALEDAFLKRGISTLTFDGPGQGEGKVFGPLTPDWASVLGAIVDFLKNQNRLRGGIGVFGMAFGGHLVLQGAHAVPEIDGIVCMNGFYDFGQFWEDLPPVYRANMRYALGGETPADTEKAARRFSLKETPAPECPVLVIHGGQDSIFPPSEAEDIGEWVNTAVDIVIYPNGNHVCNNLAYRYRALCADWLAEILRSR